MECTDSGSDVSQPSERLSQLSDKADDRREDDDVTTNSNRSPSGHRGSESGSADNPANRSADLCAETPHENIDKHSKNKNPFKLLRRLTLKTEKKVKQNETETGTGTDGKPSPPKIDRLLAEVKVDSLPQVFVTKYLGYRPCQGLWGVKHIRAPVEQLVAEASSSNPETGGDDLPLVQLRVSLGGIHVREHSANACRSRRIATELIPIEFISYGVQDPRHTRLFAFILVRQMSSRSRDLECHVYVCDSTATCRRLSLSVALAFKEYSKNLQGKPYKFQVDLRSGHENGQPGDEDEGGAEDFEA